MGHALSSKINWDNTGTNTGQYWNNTGHALSSKGKLFLIKFLNPKTRFHVGKSEFQREQKVQDQRQKPGDQQTCAGGALNLV